MDKKFLPVMGLMAFVLISVNDLNAKESPPVRKPPTVDEIEKAYENCLKHECEDFAEWSIEASEVCSEGGEEACEEAREILEEIHSSHVGEAIYDNYFPHSFKEDDEPGNAP